MQRSGPTWVSGVLALVLLGACQGSGEPSGDPTSAPTASSDAVATSTAPTEDAEPTTAAPSFEEDQAGAAQIVEEFHATLDELSQDPSVPVQDLARVANSQALLQWVSNIQDRRDRQSVQTGDTGVTVTQVETVEEGTEFEVTTCLDLSEVRFNGAKPDRGEIGDRQQTTYGVSYDALADRLFVSQATFEYEPCGD